MRIAVIAVLVVAFAACSSDDAAREKMEAERKAALEKAKTLQEVTKPDPPKPPQKVPSKEELIESCNGEDGAACQGACALGDAESCVKLGTLFEEARGGVPENFESARVFHRKGCDGGAGSGCYALALFYKLGKSIPKDPKRAKKYFKRGCELKFRPACTELSSPTPAP